MSTKTFLAKLLQETHALGEEWPQLVRPDFSFQ